jgi:hypothetical protein
MMIRATIQTRSPVHASEANKPVAMTSTGQMEPAIATAEATVGWWTMLVR